MRNILLVILLLSGLSCSAKQELQCGDLLLEFEEVVNKNFENQVNWGEGYSCSYNRIDDKDSFIRLFYKNVSIKKTSSDIEKSISEFYALDQNINKEKVFNKVLSGIHFYCFDDFDQDIEKEIEKCYSFKDKKLIRVIFSKQ